MASISANMPLRNCSLTKITEVETIKRQTRAMYDSMATGQSPWPRAWTAA